MHPTKIILMAMVCCLALLNACQRQPLPATTPPIPSVTEPATEPITEAVTATSPHTMELEVTITTSSSPVTEFDTVESENITTEQAPDESESITTEPVYTSTPPQITESAITTSTPPPATEPTTTSPPVIEETTTAPPATESITEPSAVPAVPSPTLNRSNAEEAFHLQNQYLSQHNVTPLLWSESLYQIAARRAEDISYSYTHQGCPDWVAENILMGTDRPDLAVKIWYDSPGHQHNMLAGWTYGAAANFGNYWVAIYAMAETP